MNTENNPTKNGNDTPQLRRALLRACELAELNPQGARLVHYYVNAVYVLPAEYAVVRLQHGRDGRQRAARSLDITRWLVHTHGFPATAPLPELDAIAVDETTTATFWIYYPQPDDGPKPTSAHLGRLIHHLHELPPSPIELPRWTPLRSLEAALHTPSAEAVMDSDERSWLLDRIRGIRHELQALDWPLGWGLIHGDAWAGNLLWNTQAGPYPTVLGDWDSVCWGPREIDLIPSFHAARRYDRGTEWAQAFANAYGYDLSHWRGLPTLMAMRDLIQVTGPLNRAPHEPALAQALRQRLDGIRNGDNATWTEF